MGWKLTYGGHELREDEALMGHLVAVAELVGRDEWSVADPMTSPRTLSAWLAVLIASRTGKSVDEVAAFLGTIPASRLVRAYTVVDDQAPEPAPTAEREQRMADMVQRLAERQRAG